MITDWIGWHEVLLPIEHNDNKIILWIGFSNLKHKKFREYILLAVKKRPLSAHVRWRILSNYLGMMGTVLLPCPISAEIRTVDSQSDLRIFYSFN